VQPHHCYMGGGAYCSIIASISWVINAQALLLPDLVEWSAVPTNLKEFTTEMTAVVEPSKLVL
jgi:hypothetical protein